MTNGSVTGHAKSRVDRGLLKLGTILGGGAVAVLLVPAAAHAADRFASYRLTEPALQSADAASNESRKLSAEPNPQDLTIRAMAQTALPVARAAGAGDVTYSGGDITTTGDYTPGIATTSSGATTITANSVTTSGYSSPAVFAVGNGPIGVNVGTVTTNGDLSGGIFAYSQTGAVKIDAGDVSTTGSASQGIDAIGSSVTVTAGSVLTTGFGSDGILAETYAPGGVVDITINGQVETVDTLSLGVSGGSSGGSVTIHDNGSVTTLGQGGSAFFNGFAIGILGYAAGDVTIDGGGNVATFGNASDGVEALSKHGNISIDLGSVTTSGSGSIGILANATAYDPYTQRDVGTGDVAITADTIQTTGDYSAGISGNGRNVDVTVNGSVSTQGRVSAGIAAFSPDGDVTIHNNGAIATTGLGSTGILTQAYGNITVNGEGQISTGRAAYGVKAQSIGGSISISQGDISSGFGGVHAVAYASSNSPDGLGDPGNGITISVGNVATTDSGALNPGNPSAPDGIFAVNTNVGAGVSIDASSVTTRGDYADGVYAFTRGQGPITVNAGSVATRGIRANGITAFGESIDLTAGSVSTEGDFATGIVAYAGTTPGGHASINVGSATTTGNGALAIYGKGDHVAITAGAITTSGDNAFGLIAKGDTSVSVSDSQSISTQGNGASGVLAEGQGYSSVNVDLGGAISTTGGGAVGVTVVGVAGDVNVKANTITTTGANADALAVYGLVSAPTVSISSASTSGGKSPAVIIQGGYGLNFTAGTLATSGDVSNALILRSGSYGGAIGVATIGTITTTGNGSAGIDAIAAGDADHSSSLTLNVNSITTSGVGSVGISAMAGYGAVNIQAGSIKTSGDAANGILTWGGSDIGIQVGSVDTAATSIYANGAGVGAISLGVTGKVASSGGSGAILMNNGGATTVTVGAGGSIAGAVDGLRIESGTGEVTITNAGSISGGSGYAIALTGLPQPVVAARVGTVTAAAAPVPGAQITNSGVIAGAVLLTAGDDVLTNSGTFLATKDSDFGAGNDLFVNTGKLVVSAGSNPGNVTLLGLESFQNAGLIDLRNNVPGDTLTLPGNYVASGKAALGFDVGANGVADKLIVNGTVTGTTSVLINASASNATLLSKPITLIQGGTGSPSGAMAANAFTLANQSIGFVAYGLGYNAASNSFQLSAQAGAPVYRLAKTSEGAQSIWREAAGAWENHMAELRDLGDTASRVWGQAYGKVDSQHDHDNGYDVGYRQDYYGAQAGYDIGGHRSDSGDGLLFGVTGGYLSSHLNFRAGADRVHFDTVDIGGYANAQKGVLFANLLGQYAHYSVTGQNAVDLWSDKFSGNGYGVEGEVGARLGTASLFAEPVASLAWQKTDLDTLHALGQSLAFDHDTALTGKLGARIGGGVDMAGGSQAVFYLRGSYVHEFKGNGGVLFNSGGASQSVSGTGLGDYGQAALGINLLTTGRVSGFIEGDADVGGSTHGGGGRVGLRFKL